MVVACNQTNALSASVDTGHKYFLFFTGNGSDLIDPNQNGKYQLDIKLQ